MFDLAVIGGGPGGYTAAIRGAQKGLKTIMIEKDTIGGTCLNRGCIPTKSLIYDSKLFSSAKNSPVMTGTDNLLVDPEKLINRKRNVVRTLVNGLEKIIQTHAIDLRAGKGEIVSANRIRVFGDDGTCKTIEASNIILATGSRPAVPPFINVDGTYIQTTDHALDSTIIPQSIVIIGGGVIGIEMAAIYSNLGSKVTIIEMLSEILTTEDMEIRKTMLKLLKKHSADVYLRSSVKELSVKDKSVTVLVENNEGTTQTLSTDKVLVAVGRSPVLDGINCNKLGIDVDGPFIKIGQHNETTLPGVYAIGDLVGGMMLAHKAAAEAEKVIDHIAGADKQFSVRQIPRCIWGLTEIGAIGLNEAEARETGKKIKIGRFSFAASSAAQAMGDTHGFVKIIGDAYSGEILGVHIMGAHATDLIGEAASVMKMEGTVEDLYEAIKPHPTLSETVVEASLDWNGLAVHALKHCPDRQVEILQTSMSKE